MIKYSSVYILRILLDGIERLSRLANPSRRRREHFATCESFPTALRAFRDLRILLDGVESFSRLANPSRGRRELFAACESFSTASRDFPALGFPPRRPLRFATGKVAFNGRKGIRKKWVEQRKRRNKTKYTDFFSNFAGR